MTAVLPVWTQQNFRGRNDNGSESAATWIANVNTNFSQAVDIAFRVRLSITETAGATKINTPVFVLQYNLGGAGWNTVTTTAVWSEHQPAGMSPTTPLPRSR